MKREAFLVEVVVVQLGVRDALLLSADALPVRSGIEDRSLTDA